MPDNTAEEQPKHGAERLEAYKFKKGQSGNPKGRPKSARSKLSESFIQALADDFEKNGVSTLEALRTDKPEAYVAAISKLVPKEVDHTSSDGSMTPQQTVYQLPDNGRTKA